MHALTAQVVLVGDLGQRKTGLAHLGDVVIAQRLGRRSWLEWAPRPSPGGIECIDAILGQFVVLFALTHIAYPSPEVNVLAAEGFDVSCGHEGITLSGDVLL
mgnify:CR=1 FL=1